MVDGDENKKGIIAKVSKYSNGGRLHAEIPAKKRHLFEAGDHVRIKKVRK